MTDGDHLPFDPNRVTLPPGYRMVAVGSHYTDPDDENSATAVGVMYLDHSPRPDANVPPDQWEHNHNYVLYGSLETGWLEGARCRTPEQLAVVATAAVVVNELHEAMEFVKVDGDRVFNPHPYGDEQWEWMQRRVERLLADYRRTFPTEAAPQP